MSYLTVHNAIGLNPKYCTEMYYLNLLLAQIAGANYHLLWLEMYWKCTGNVLEMYWKCTGNVLEIYWKDVNCATAFQLISQVAYLSNQ